MLTWIPLFGCLKMRWPSLFIVLLLGVVLVFVPFGLVLSFGSQGSLLESLFWRGGCTMGVGRDATLHGSPTDPRVTWATDNGSGMQIEILWPVGYSARFDPNVEVFDASGKVVGREADLIVGSCATPPNYLAIWRIEARDIRPPSWQPGAS